MVVWHKNNCKNKFDVIICVDHVHCEGYFMDPVDENNSHDLHRLACSCYNINQ